MSPPAKNKNCNMNQITEIYTRDTPQFEWKKQPAFMERQNKNKNYLRKFLYILGLYLRKFFRKGKIKRTWRTSSSGPPIRQIQGRNSRKEQGSPRTVPFQSADEHQRKSRYANPTHTHKKQDPRVRAQYVSIPIYTYYKGSYPMGKNKLFTQNRKSYRANG